MRLFEQERPKTWAQVVGQSKVIGQIETLRRFGLGGRAYLFTGSSGTGKTTIAKLLALEIADEFNVIEIDAKELSAKDVQEMERSSQTKRIGEKNGCVFIVNEVHGLRESTILQLLTTLDEGRIPQHVAWVFTTTSDGAEKLFSDCDDAGPLTSRCSNLPLARRDLTKPFAIKLKETAEKLSLGGKPLAAYEKLLQLHKNNMRACYQHIEMGGMVGDE